MTSAGPTPETAPALAPRMTETQADPIRFEVSGGVAVLTLDRPATLNAIDADFARALGAAIGRAEVTDGVRALVLRGAGSAFCAGGDVSKFNGREPHADVAGRAMFHFHPAVLKLASARLPTVAAVHGAVAGAGIGLMLACDFVVAAANARFTLAYPKIGATIDGGASWFLPRLVGLRKAKELTMLSEHFDATMAEKLGLVNRVVAVEAFDEETAAFARKLAAGPTAAYATIKQLLGASFERGLAEQLDAERTAFVDMASSTDFSEGLDAFLGKRAPDFRGK